MLNKNDKKNIIWNTIGTTINAFSSLLFMIIVTRINGISDAGIYTYGFSIACLFNVIGIYSGRIYQVTDNTEITDNDYFVNKLITCLIMFLVTIVFLIFNNYSIWKTSIIFSLCILKTFEAFEEVLYAFLQKDNYLYKVGISLTIKTLFGLISFLLIDIFTNNILFSSISVILINLLVAFCYDLKNVNKNLLSIKKINWKNIFLIFKRGFLSFLLTFMIMYIINIPRYIIDAKMDSEFSTIFGIIIMPATFMVLISQFILHPFLLKLKNYIKIGNKQKIKNLIIKMNLFILIIGIFILIIVYFLGIPVLEFIYNIKLTDYKTSLLIVIAGSIMYGMVTLLSNVLVSMRVLFSQVIIYIIVTIVSLFASNVLIVSSGVEGGCISYSITMILMLIGFIITTIYSVIKIKGVKKIAKS